MKKKGAEAGRWQEDWMNFEQALKTEARFFNRSAARHLTALFDGIDQMQTRDGRALVVDAGPNTGYPEIYRARVFRSESHLEEALTRPDQHLGSPARPRRHQPGISVSAIAISRRTQLASAAVCGDLASDFPMMAGDVISGYNTAQEEPLHTTNLRKVGGSVMLAVPPAVLDMLQLRAGATVALVVDGGRLIVEPKSRRRYTLDELLAQCDHTAESILEDREWLDARPVGRELL
jgi:antitoxin ChpS